MPLFQMPNNLLLQLNYQISVRKLKKAYKLLKHQAALLKFENQVEREKFLSF